MKHLAVLIAGFAISTAALEAQGPPAGVPDSHRPPPGMCRIWIDGVPPAHQPAPTDCATAIRKRPMNARVVFGSEPAGVARGFVPSHPSATPAPAPNAAVVPNTQPHDYVDRAAQQQREDQERQRAAQQRAEEAKRAARRDPPPAATQHDNHQNAAPAERPRVDKAPRPPHQSFSTHRPR